MSDTTLLETITSDAGKALEAIPVATQAIAAAQADLTADQHKDVLVKASDMLQVAAQSAEKLGQQAIIGHNDAENIEAGVALAGNGLTIGQEIEALIARVRAFIARL